MTKLILKSILTGAAFVAGSFLTNAIAQNGAVTSAEFLVSSENPNYEKALEKIREATYHPKTQDKAKTWYVRAKVFTSVFEGGTTNTEVAALVKNPLDSAFASMNKALELEKAEGKDTYTKKIEDPVFQGNTGMETGLQVRIKNTLLNQVQKYQEAEDFTKAYESMIPIVTYLPKDTTNLIYIGYFASKAEKIEQAAIHYEQLGDMEEYTGGVEAYQSAAYSYYKLEDSTNFLRILEKGLKRYPQESYFITNIADIYIRRKDYMKAIELLKQANEIKPNASTLTNIALMYQQEKQPEKAVEYFKKVLEIDSQNYDANFAVALHYYRQAADPYNELNMAERDITNPTMKPIIENADQSIIYAKKAIEINNEDETLYKLMKDLYTIKNDEKNIELMENKIKEKK